MKPLTNFDIDKKLQNVKNYKGTFMSDALPERIADNGSYVVNLDKQRDDGTHWVAIYNDPKNDYVEYFDSFGLQPNKDTERFLRTSGKSIKMNSTQLQHLMSKSCGYFAIWYIQERNKGKSQYDVIYSMSMDNPLENEGRIKQYFKL